MKTSPFEGKRENLSRGHPPTFVTTSRTASVTPRARETRRRTILTKNCRAGTSASYAWWSRERERERERKREREREKETIMAGRVRHR